MKKIYSAKRFFTALCLTAIFTIASLSAFAQPVNDACSGAITLTTGAAATSGTSVAATFSGEPAIPACKGGASNATVWYQFTPTSAGTVTITLTPAGTVRAWVEVLASPCGASMTSLACSYGAAAGNVVSLNYAVTSGTTYYIRTGGNNAQEGAHTISVTNPGLVYCTPTFSSGCAADNIGNVTFGTINNTTTCGTAYTYYTSPTTSIARGCTKSCVVTMGSGSSTEKLGIYIDYNADGDFADPGELVYNGTTQAASHTASVTIPATAALGRTRMRCSATYTTNPSADGCGAYTWGECEDYDVTITAAVTQAVAGSDQSLGCPNTTTLAGNDPGAFTGTWSVVTGSGNFANVNQFNTGVTAVGGVTNTYRWTISNGTGAGACSTFDDVVITRSTVAANAGPDQNICGATATLAANAQTAPATGAWSVVSGSATFNPSANANNATATVGVGINVLRWTVNDNGSPSCSVSDDVTIYSVVTDIWTGLGAAGNWNDANNWDSGVPPACANVVISNVPNQPNLSTAATFACANLTINQGASLIVGAAATLAPTGNLIINGTLTNNGRVNVAAAKTFEIGPFGTYTHNPATSDAANATMFTNGNETFYRVGDETAGAGATPAYSTLIIKKWYTQATVGLAANMNATTPHYGNVEIDLGSAAAVWPQNNQLGVANEIKGTLTVKNAYVEIGNTDINCPAKIGNVILDHANAILVGQADPAAGPANTFSLTTKTIAITTNGGTFYPLSQRLFATPNNNAFIVANSITVAGGTLDTYLPTLAGVPTGNLTYTIAGAITVSANGKFYGMHRAGTTNITGNLTLDAATISLSGAATFIGIENGSGLATIGNTTAPAISIAGTASFTGVKVTAPLTNAVANVIKTGTINLTGGSFAANISGTGTTTLTSGILTLSGTSSFTGVSGVTGAPASGAFNFTVPSISLVSGTPTCNIGGAFGTGVFTTAIANDVTVNAGTLTLKKDQGAATLTIAGNVVIGGGELDVCDGTNTAAIGITVNGDFALNSGVFEFEKGTPNATGTRTLTLKKNFTHAAGTFRGVNEVISTVVYNGTTAQTITGPVASTFNSLTLDNVNGLALATGSPIDVNKTLTLTAGSLLLGNSDLTLATGADPVAGTPALGKMIITNGTGVVNKLYAGTNPLTYTFPIGETTGVTEFTPITVAFTAGTYAAGAGVKVKVVNTKHPNNGSPNHYLNRYWSVQPTGITGMAANVSATYMNADISGTETEIANGRYPNALPWTKGTAVGDATNTLSFTGTTGLGDFSGITLDPPTVTVIANGSTNDSISRCEAETPTQLDALAVGDAGFKYAWTPVIGLSSATIANPLANPSTTQTYTVTATDTNGITASTTFKVKVVPAPTITLGASPAVCSGITTAVLPYTAVANNPTTYTIDYDPAAQTEGFVDITTPANLTFPTPSNIILNIPAAATPAIYNATLTVISPTGCKSVPVAFTVTINPIPEITLGQDPRVCRGVTATTLPYSGATGAADQYKIDFDATATGQGFANVPYTALTPGSVPIGVPPMGAPGVYNATITIKNSSTTCSPAPYSFTVTIDSIPKINLTSANYNVCQGATVADVTYSSTEGSPNQYKLTFDAAAKSAGFTDVPFTALPDSPIVVDIPAGVSSRPYNVSIAVKTPFGCVSNPATAFKITMNDYPDVPIVESPVTYCQNATANPLATQTGTNLVWYNDPPIGPGSSTAPTPSTATEGTITYYVSETNAVGCESDKVQIDVIVRPLPSLIFDSLHCVAGQGETNTFLSYNTKINNPDIYGILFDDAAKDEGFQNVGDEATAVLGDSPVVFEIPETAPVGTYYGQFGVQDTVTGCFSFQAFTIDIITSTIPTISLAANPVVCQGTDSTILHYTSTTNNPDSYTIDFDPTAEAQGFADIPYTPLGGSIKFAVPVGGTPATYKATITVVNNTTGDTSRVKGFKVTIAPPAPSAPTSIQGSTSSCPFTTTTYRIAAVPTASTYTWSIPTGWAILAGQGTTTLTVRVGSFGQDGTIAAIANNSCGSSSATTLAVTVNPAAPAGTSSISGPTAACPGASINYTVAPIANATEYYWSVPANWVVTGGDGTGTITVNASNTPGDNGTIQVYSANECGFNPNPTQLAVTVAPFATPSVAIALTNGTNPTCSTQPLTFTATPTRGGTAPTYQWMVNGVNVAGATTSTFNTASLANNDNVMVAMTSNFNCASPATTTSNFINMAVKPIPTAPAATTPLTYCQNANAKPLEASGSNLLWYAAATGGASTSIPPKPSTVVVGTSSYYVTQTVSGCESPRTQIDVSITANPAAPTVTTPVNYCQNGASPALTATGNSLLWYTTASGGTGSGTAPRPSTATISTITYYVTQTISSCESPRQKIEAVINPIPAAPMANSPITFCQNALSAALTASGSDLLWYTPTGGATGTATVPRPSTSSAGTKNYFVTQTVKTCESPKTKIEVNVISLPPTPVPSANTPVCSGAKIELKTPTVTGATYAWQGPNNFSSTQQNPVISNATVAMAGTYAVRAIANGCQSSPGGVTVDINQSINTVVTIVRSTPFDDICAGTTVVFTAKPTNPGTDPQYKWKINGVVVGPNGTEFITNSLDNNDVVTCTMTSSVTCPSPAVAVSNEKSFSVTDIPEKPAITQDGSVLRSSSTKGNEWYFNGEYVAGGNSIVMEKTGQYKLVVIINGCSSPFSDPVDFVKEGTSVNSVTGINLLNVFPNPTEDNFTVSFNAVEKATYQVVLFNSIGQVVLKEELKDFIGAYSKLINTEELGKGIYSLSVIADKYQTTKKVVVY